MHKKDFEADFLKTSLCFYKAKAQIWKKSMTDSQYFNAVDQAFRDEEKRLERYIDASSKGELLQALVGQLLVFNSKTIFGNMLDHNKRDELKQMFNIFKYHEASLDHIIVKFTEHFETKGG